MAHGSPLISQSDTRGLAAALPPPPSLQYASFVSGTLTLDFGRPLFRVQLITFAIHFLRKLV